MTRLVGSGVRAFLVLLLAASLQGCGQPSAEPTEPSTPGVPKPFAVSWLKGFGSTGTEFPFQLSSDGAEQVTIVGASSGSIDWGQGLLTPEDGYAPFVVALNGGGDSLFSTMARVLNDQQHAAVAADRAGGAVVAGGFAGLASMGDSLDWDGLQLVAPAPGSAASFVVHLGVDGLPIWGRAFAAGSSLSSPSIAVDSHGDVLWAGAGAHDVDFGSGPQSGDAFLVKLDAAGQLVWSKVFSKSVVESFLEPLGVAVDSAGNVVLLGNFTDAVDLGAGPLVPAEGGDVFVAKFDADGNLLWNRAAGGWRGGGVEAGVAVGPDDEIAVTAPFNAAATFGAPSDRDAGSGNVLVARLDPDGTPAFIRRDGGVSGSALAIDGAGQIVVTGSGIPEGVPEPASANSPNFVLEYDASGAVSRYLLLDGDSVFSECLAATEGGSVFVAGRFGVEVSAGQQTLHGAGGFDIYVGRLEP